MAVRQKLGWEGQGMRLLTFVWHTHTLAMVTISVAQAVAKHRTYPFTPGHEMVGEVSVTVIASMCVIIPV